MMEVLDDENAWLVIDGIQSESLLWNCHILHVCFLKKDNYHEYAKNLRVKRQYLPVWEKEEVCEFLDEFEQHRSSFKEMQVLVKEEALLYFGKIGGIPRFVQCGRQSEERLTYIVKSMGAVDKDGALEFFIGSFEGSEAMDALVHIKCGKGEDLEDGENEKYNSHAFDFASVYVRNLFGKRFEEASKANVLKFMKAYANDTSVGNQYGYLFEFVGHCLINRGGRFSDEEGY